MWCRLFLSFLTVLNPYSAYLGARGLIPREVDVPPMGEGHLGLAPAAEGPTRPCQRAFIGIEVEDLRLCYADMMAEAATAWEQAAPLAAWIKELEEELTQVASDQNTFRSRAKEAMASAKALVG